MYMFCSYKLYLKYMDIYKVPDTPFHTKGAMELHKNGKYVSNTDFWRRIIVTQLNVYIFHFFNRLEIQILHVFPDTV